MTNRNSIFNTRSQISHFIGEARKSLKILETLEEEFLGKARTLAGIPNATERKQWVRKRFWVGLKKLGLAPQSEVTSLQTRVKKLEKQLKTKHGSTASHS